MQIVDVRLPQQPHPVVPTVIRAEASATSTQDMRTPMERLYDRRARRGSTGSRAVLTEADCELIRAVTGESLWGTGSVDLENISAFAAQIVMDRSDGHLTPRSEVTVAYPFSGAELTRAIRYLTSRESGGIDIAM